MRPRTLQPSRNENGQALVEFSLAFIVFVVLLMAIFDFGRGIFMFNGVSQAAREIARATSVEPGIVLGAGQKSLDAVAVQRSLVPGMNGPAYACVDIAGAPSANSPCQAGDYVRVTVTATYTPVTLLGLTGPIVLSSTSSIQIPRGTP
jgi:Flp pilus assembly protein TadG